MSRTASGVQGPAPSAHLGLRWSHECSESELLDLARRCEEIDAISPRVPPEQLVMQFSGGGGSEVLIGRDSAGMVRAAGTVRHSGREVPHTVALRAFIDPQWRGRGIGRALLSWQDHRALDALSGENLSRIAVTIPSTLVDRRRLYTAAGFSSHGTVTGLTKSLADSSVGVPAVLSPGPLADGTRIVALADAPGAVDGTPSTAESLVATALYGSELVASADGDASYVAVRNGETVGAVLVHRTADSAGHPVGLIQYVLSGTAHSELLTATFHELWRSGTRSVHLRLTEGVRQQWEPVAFELGCVPSETLIVYGIEWS